MARVIELPTSTEFNEDFEDGYIMFVDHLYYMTTATYGALLRSETFAEVVMALKSRGDGTFLIPASLLRREEAEETRRMLTFAEVGPSDQCVMPGCWQDVVSVRDGFSLCAKHAGDLQSWDDLVA